MSGGTGVASGAAGGAAAGTAFAPGIGTLIGAGVGAGLGLYSSYAGAKDAKKAIAQQREIRDMRIERLQMAAANERAQQTRAAETLLGRVRVAAAASGNTLDSATRQTLVDAARNKATINQNLNSGTTDANLGLAGIARQIASTVQNPLLSGFLGAISGAGTGTNLETGIRDLGSAPSTGGQTDDLLGPIWAKYS